MPLPIDHLIERLEEEHQTSITNGYSPSEIYTLEKVLEWAKHEKQARENLNAARWKDVEPLPAEVKLKIATEAMHKIRNRLPSSWASTGLTEAIGTIITNALIEMSNV